MSLILLLYLITINLAGFIRMGQDKRYARTSRRRISEKQLFLIALCGGALGSWIGIRIWRHKTKHSSFVIGIPLLIILNITTVYLLITLMNGS